MMGAGGEAVRHVPRAEGGRWVSSWYFLDFGPKKGRSSGWRA